MANECAFHPECKAILDDIKSDVAAMRKAVLGNGAKGIKDTVAVHAFALKIIGVGVAMIGTAVIGLVIKLLI